MPKKTEFARRVESIAYLTEVANSYCELGDEPRAVERLRQAKEQLDELLEG